MTPSILDGYWHIQFIPMSISRTIMVSELLKASVKNAVPLPVGYEDIFDKYFERSKALKRRALRRKLKEVPELKEAEADILNYIRELHGVVTARLTSPNSDARNAAVTLVQDIFPTGLEIITNVRTEVLAWSMLNVERLRMEYEPEVEKARIQAEVGHLWNSVQTYVRLAARYQVAPILGPDDKSSRVLRDETQSELRGVFIELVHVVKRHPSYTPVVNAILRPLDEMMAKVRAARKRKAKTDKEAAKGPARTAKPAVSPSAASRPPGETSVNEAGESGSKPLAKTGPSGASTRNELTDLAMAMAKGPSPNTTEREVGSKAMTGPSSKVTEPKERVKTTDSLPKGLELKARMKTADSLPKGPEPEAGAKTMAVDPSSKVSTPSPNAQSGHEPRDGAAPKRAGRRPPKGRLTVQKRLQKAWKMGVSKLGFGSRGGRKPVVQTASVDDEIVRSRMTETVVGPLDEKPASSRPDTSVEAAVKTMNAPRNEPPDWGLEEVEPAVLGDQDERVMEATLTENDEVFDGADFDLLDGLTEEEVDAILDEAETESAS